jgi:hypothetical protein
LLPIQVEATEQAIDFTVAFMKVNGWNVEVAGVQVEVHVEVEVHDEIFDWLIIFIL